MWNDGNNGFTTRRGPDNRQLYPVPEPAREGGWDPWMT